MNKLENLSLDARLVPDLETATDNWLEARDTYKIEPSDENESDYNATLNDLRAAWNERYSQVGLRGKRSTGTKRPHRTGRRRVDLPTEGS